ncbi:MAG: MerR family transcriptional regulator [Halobacteriovoraceae bacterium]|jgi:MerR family transcriptional regulator, mercuric resistance operon regulatory protein|nr:MerR family transcriptional regulator [Halobacteriovoraceae bacterium]MBT5093626.1 MerR family transcriptional regulator [Halobacteriovoraceae bacterium]
MKFTIGDLAAKLKLTTQTIRFYEKRGLLPDPERTESNYRVYGEEAFRILTFIMFLKEFGFTLEEIKNILRIDPSVEGFEQNVCKLLQAKNDDIVEQIKSLEEKSKYLESFVKICTSGDHEKLKETEFAKFFKPS